MSKIPILDAVVIRKEMSYCRNSPILMGCASLSMLYETDYVVKLYGCVEIKQPALAREVIGTRLAQEMGFSTPDIAIIDVSPILTESVLDTKVKEKIKTSPGYNFGSKYLSGVQVVTNIPHNFIQEALDIFCFDMLICNPDRRVGNPNMFQTREGFILYDHEQAFYYSAPERLIGGAKEPWEYLQEAWCKNHILYPELKKYRGTLDFDSFLKKLTALSDDIFDTIISEIPDAWSTDEIFNITPHLRRARDNANLMKRSIQEVLA